MSTTTDADPPRGSQSPLSWPARFRDWLDARGPLAWVAAVIATTVVIWPLGLLLLAYAIWSHRMFTRTTTDLTARARGWTRSARTAAGSTGNRAFDARQAEALDRIAAERQAFAEFQARRKDAEDKAEFDRFMDERAAKPVEPQDDTAA
jgi:hypothetical protein